jgi:hypothetical protein
MHLVTAPDKVRMTMTVMDAWMVIYPYGEKATSLLVN